MTQWTDQVIAFATVALAIIAIVAALAAWWMSRSSIKQSEKVAQASILKDFLDEYHAEEMRKHLSNLGEFEQNNKRLLTDLNRLVTNKSDLSDEDISKTREYIENIEPKIGPSRRYVDKYYLNAQKLFDLGYLTEESFSVICDTRACGILLSTCRPLTHAVELKISEYDKTKFVENSRSFSRYDVFASFMNKSTPGRKRIGGRVTAGIIVTGVVSWICFGLAMPLSIDNMEWHPNLVALAAIFVGVGLGRTRLGRFGLR